MAHCGRDEWVSGAAVLDMYRVFSCLGACMSDTGQEVLDRKCWTGSAGQEVLSVCGRPGSTTDQIRPPLRWERSAQTT